MPFLSRIFLAAIAALILVGCSTTKPTPPIDWAAWQARRNQSIGGTNGWTTLIGLHWLKEGDNSAGSSHTNAAALRSPRVPAFVGTFTRNGTNVSFTPAAGVDVLAGHEKVTAKIVLKTDASPEPTRLKIGEVSIIVIQRGERIGLRVKDPESDARRNFKGLSWFPYDPTWVLDGQFIAFPRVRTMKVADVTGGTQEYASPGQIIFKANGTTQSIDVADEGDEAQFFLIFRDKTSGDSTYHAGRFLYVPKPDDSGHLIMDFNHAFTPPCGFTDYATCPLPPPQNWLTVAVKVGERKPRGTNNNRTGMLLLKIGLV